MQYFKNTGLLDALHLAENLIEGAFSDIPSALKDYEEKMFLYASIVQVDTAEAEDGIHSGLSLKEVVAQMNGSVA